MRWYNNTWQEPPSNNQEPSCAKMAWSVLVFSALAIAVILLLSAALQSLLAGPT